jgi:hypothetical protein
MKKTIFIFTTSLLYAHAYGMERLPKLPVPSLSSVKSNECRDLVFLKTWEAGSRSELEQNSILAIKQENNEPLNKYLKTYAQLHKQKIETAFAELTTQKKTTEKNGTHSAENKKALIEQKHSS